MRTMTTTEWIEFIEFTSHMLFMLVAFMSGLIMGYMIGFRNGGGL
jgi:hypothetical protein